MKKTNTPKKPTPSWTGSAETYNRVLLQIIDRWGKTEARRYNPKTNCFTFNQWLKRGYKVRKGQKALKSYTFVEIKDEDGEVYRKFHKPISLFYIRQVEKMPSKKVKSSK